eukprot:1181295-Prorocentrum_minimum.AAC.2
MPVRSPPPPYPTSGARHGNAASANHRGENRTLLWLNGILRALDGRLGRFFGVRKYVGRGLNSPGVEWLD